MPIDPSIAMGVRPVQIDNPLNAMARALQVKGMVQQQEMGEFDAQLKRQALDRQNRMNAILAGGGGVSELMKGGYLTEARQLAETNSKTAREKIAADKDAAELEHKAIAMYRDASLGVSDPQGAAALVMSMRNDPRLANSPMNRIPVEQALAQIPQDPNQLAEWRQKFALGAQKYMELNKPTITTRNLGGTTDTIAVEGLTGKTTTLNSARNTQSPDNAATVATTRRGQDMADERARDAAAMAANVYDPERGVVVNKGTGLARPAATMDGKPLGLKDKNPPQEFSKAMTGVNELSRALDTYETALKEANGAGPLSVGDRRAKLQAAYTSLKMGLKNAFELGALTGPDVGVLEGMLVDPTSPKTVILGDKGIAEQIAQTRNYLANRESALETTYGRQNPGKRPAKSSGATGSWGGGEGKVVDFGSLR